MSNSSNFIFPSAPFAPNSQDYPGGTKGDIRPATINGVMTQVINAEEKTSAVIAEGNRSWWRKLVPNEIDRARAEAELKLCKTEFDAMHKILVIVRTASIQTLEEAANATLLKGKASVRAEVLAFATTKARELITNVGVEADLVADLIAARRQRADALGPEEKEFVVLQCREHLILFKQFSDDVLVQFRSLLQERVKVGNL